LPTYPLALTLQPRYWLVFTSQYYVCHYPGNPQIVVFLMSFSGIILWHLLSITANIAKYKHKQQKIYVILMLFFLPKQTFHFISLLKIIWGLVWRI
jgi:hypothetical protein